MPVPKWSLHRTTSPPRFATTHCSLRRCQWRGKSMTSPTRTTRTRRMWVRPTRPHSRRRRPRRRRGRLPVLQHDRYTSKLPLLPPVAGKPSFTARHCGTTHVARRCNVRWVGGCLSKHGGSPGLAEFGRCQRHHLGHHEGPDACPSGGPRHQRVDHLSPAITRPPPDCVTERERSAV